MDKYENMSGAEIGREFAPESIKDREGWGRKTLRSIRDMGVSVTDGLKNLGLLSRSQADVHMNALMNISPLDVHQYKAPHAYRGTPKKPRFSRYARNRVVRH